MKTFGLCLLCLLLGFDLGWNTSRTEQRWYSLGQTWSKLQERQLEPGPGRSVREAVARGGYLADIEDWLKTRK